MAQPARSQALSCPLVPQASFWQEQGARPCPILHAIQGKPAADVRLVPAPNASLRVPPPARPAAAGGAAFHRRLLERCPASDDLAGRAGVQTLPTRAVRQPLSQPAAGRGSGPDPSGGPERGARPCRLLAGRAGPDLPLCPRPRVAGRRDLRRSPDAPSVPGRPRRLSPRPDHRRRHSGSGRRLPRRLRRRQGHRPPHRLPPAGPALRRRPPLPNPHRPRRRQPRGHWRGPPPHRLAMPRRRGIWPRMSRSCFPPPFSPSTTAP